MSCRFFWPLALVAIFAGSAPGGDPTAANKKRQAESHAVVAGTVFRDPGFALPDAKVVLIMNGDSKAKKLQEANTNTRGEFAFRVPPKQAEYIVRATMKGYQGEEKRASITNDERIEVNLILVPEPK